MKTFLALFTLALSVLGYSQDYNFKPNWNEGTVKYIKIVRIERTYEDETLISDTTLYNEAQIKVLKDNRNDYTLEVLFENQALRAAVRLYEKLGEELKDLQDLRLIFSVKKETAESTLLNWKEAQRFMNTSFDQIYSVITDKVPDASPYIELLFLPLQEIFDNKENLEEYMQTNIGYILIPFNKNFQIGKTITHTETQKNPFGSMQEISATTLLTLESVNEHSKTGTIHQEIKLDLTEFTEMIKSMVSRMSQSVSDEELSPEKIKEIDAFEIDVKNNQVIIFNYETNWITKVIRKEVVSGVNPKKAVKTKKETITTIDIQ